MAIKSHNHSALSEKMQRCHDYIQALEEERRKIHVFRRELPLCLELVTQAIDSCKQQLSGTTTEHNLNGQSESSEHASIELPVLEEFIPIKRASSHSDLEEQESKKLKIVDINVCNKDFKSGSNDKNIKKSDWLRSVQLWNQTPDPPSKEDDSLIKVEVNRNGSGGAFHPFKKEKNGGTTIARPDENSVPPASTSSTAGIGGDGNKKEGKEGQSRKARRCWSPELHKRFLQALRQLGGSHLATPKQIRDLMKVDGLTNDEVKSHLQKYRLHTKRPSPIQNTTTATQAPQFVVLTGGLWMPPEYTTAMATTAMSGKEAAGAATNGICAPIAALPPPFQETLASPEQKRHKISNPDDLGCHSEHGVSNSPAASSSTHTTIASPTY